MRLLGIPTVLDRLIQQALHQVLSRSSIRTSPTPPTASGRGGAPTKRCRPRDAYCRRTALGGRPRPGEVLRPRQPRHADGARGAQGQGQAGAAADPPLPAGRIDDGRAGHARQEGTPQGGPLSPLLSNILLDELDKELERRGHAFCRYADDCNIYVRSRRAGERVMASITRFLAERLRLTVNVAKSAVDRPWKRNFLGYTMTAHQQPRLRVAPQQCRAAARQAQDCIPPRARTLHSSYRQGTHPDPARLDRTTSGWRR